MNTVLRIRETERPGPTTPRLGRELRRHRDLLGRRLGSDVRRRAARAGLLLGADALATALGAALVARALAPPSGTALAPLPLLVALVLTGQIAARTYGPIRRAWNPERVCAGLLLSFAILVVTGYAEPDLRPAWTPALFLGGFLAASLIAVRWSLSRFVRALYRRGIGVKNALVVGAREDARELVERFRAGRTDDVRVIGHLSVDSVADPTAIGTLSELRALMEAHDVRSVIVSSRLRPATFQQLVAESFAHGAAVSMVPSTVTALPARFGSRTLFGWPVLELRVPRLHLVQLLSKRVLDLAGSFAALLLLAPFWMATALAVRLEGRPVLFRQTRLGVGGRPFTIYKFRSMRPDAEALLRDDEVLHRKYLDNDYKLPAAEDPRISRLGRVIRRTSLDELPQLFNVLKGDMSLVGPRPIVPDEIREYGEEAHTFLAVRPGITGWWQVNGRSEVCYPERAELDMAYVDGWSVLLDLKILAMTLPRILRGAH